MADQGVGRGPGGPPHRMTDTLSPLVESLAAVEERILKACARAGRRREEVTLLAVTKIFPAQAILDAYALGLREFGENYVQEARPKIQAVGRDRARWHFIGHLQTSTVFDNA